ncbi:MAG: hypothetical protein K9H12_03735 [Bacteroidales bacterium]|nr:hypothetical protein [Bacteroidales bacterium]
MLQSGKITWRSPSNIALVKYWGKKGFQLPANPSISMTLDKSFTETSIEYQRVPKQNKPEFTFLFHGKKNPKFEEKIGQFLKIAADRIPILNSLHLNIHSENSFPHSVGIASSASSISSLALIIHQINNEISGESTTESDNIRLASELARMGSGSACRSVYGGWSLWGKTDGILESDDKYAISLNAEVHENFKNYHDAILIVNSDPKAVSSSFGHDLMKTNPFKEIREKTAKNNALELLSALKTGDESLLASLVEQEAAGLHSMFLTSLPPFVLIKPESLHIINKMNQFRKETGLLFTYTLDAGPNIHLLYSDKIRDKILPFIHSELTVFCENGKWIDDKIGKGPVCISENNS